MPRLVFVSMIASLLLASQARAGEKEIADSLATLRAVGKEGKGSEAAAAAWKTLTAEGLPAMLPTLAAFKDSNAFSANWLRSAIDAIVEAEAKAGRKLPADSLQVFVKDTKQNPDARRIAFELLDRQQPDLGRELLGTLIDDPNLDLRRDAIALRLKHVDEKDGSALAKLFAAARDRDQVEDVAKRLGKPREEVVRHFNFITRWHIVGPFDGPKASGFATKYAPEDGVDLKASYDGKGGGKIAWKLAATKDLEEDGEKDFCLVDLTKEIGKHKDAVTYAYAVIVVEKETPVQLRGASQNAVKFFLNGKLVFEREAYHQGTVMDQHSGSCVLKPGRNEILYKICQNDQKEPWAQRWVFQLRVCDSTGGPVPFTQVSPAAEGK